MGCTIVLFFTLILRKISMNFSFFYITYNYLFALNSAIDSTTFQETSPLEIMTAFITNFFSLRRYWNIIAKTKTKSKKGRSRSIKKRDLKRTRDLFHVLLTLTGYVEVLVIPAGARRIKVVEEKPAHSYLGNLTQSQSKYEPPSPCPDSSLMTTTSICF